MIYDLLTKRRLLFLTIASATISLLLSFSNPALAQKRPPESKKVDISSSYQSYINMSASQYSVSMSFDASNLSWSTSDRGTRFWAIKTTGGPTSSFNISAGQENASSKPTTVMNASSDVGPNRSYTLTFFYEYGRDCSGVGNITGCDEIWYTVSKTQTVTTPRVYDVYNKVLNSVNSNGTYKPTTIQFEKGTSISNSYINYGLRFVNAGSGNVIWQNTYSGTQLSQTVKTVDISTVAGATMPNGTYYATIETSLSSGAPSDWNRDSSRGAQATDYVTVLNKNLTASDSFSGRVRLNWETFKDVIYVQNIQIYKNNELIATVGKNVDNYTDLDVIPGYSYNYQIKLVTSGAPSYVSSWASNQVIGSSSSNGRISGFVTTANGIGVDSVSVKLESKEYIFNGVNNQKIARTVFTDASGFYEFRNVLYGDGADYNISASMGEQTDRFKPSVTSRYINEDLPTVQNVNFLDLASITVSGNVAFDDYKVGQDTFTFPVKGAEIWLNGQYSGVKTDSFGNYSLNVPNPGYYTLQVKYQDHLIHFKDAENTNAETTRLYITRDRSNVNFIDKQKENLTIKVAANCDKPIGETASVEISSTVAGIKKNNVIASFSQEFEILSDAYTAPIASFYEQNKSGEIIVTLPATTFAVSVKDISTITEKENNISKNQKIGYFSANYNKIDVDLSKKDSIYTYNSRVENIVTPAVIITKPNGVIDTISKEIVKTNTILDSVKIVKPQHADFIFNYKPKLIVSSTDLDGIQAVTADGSSNAYKLLEKLDKPQINIKVSDAYTYGSQNAECYNSNATIYVYDEVSDSKKAEILKIESLNGVNYRMKVGDPNFVGDHLKNLFITAYVNEEYMSYSQDFYVTGEKANDDKDFLSGAPLPLFILHDPPGDKSYATISKGSSISSSYVLQQSTGSSTGAYANIAIGFSASIPFVGDVGAGVTASASYEQGTDKTTASTTTITTTFSEDFSTSGEDHLVGADGDVYVGTTMNFLYAGSKNLIFKNNNFTVEHSTAMNPSGFSSTYIYTEHHIKNVLIPELDKKVAESHKNYQNAISGSKPLAEIHGFDKIYKQLLASLNSWKDLVEKNRINRLTYGPVSLPSNTGGLVGDNISLSAGAVYDNTVTMSSDQEKSIEFQMYVDKEASAGITAEALGTELEAGVVAKFRFNQTNSSTNTTSTSITTKYHLEDDDLGDAFTINIGRDKTFGTPVFETLAGRSSCPHEENTVARFKPQIRVSSAKEVKDVPADKAAKFELSIANISDTEEYAEYALRINPNSNLDGAKISIAGQDATNGQATFRLKKDTEYKVPVEILRGPLANVYDKIEIVMYPLCDNSLDDIGSETKPSVEVSATFQNDCSQIDILSPSNNWVVNSTNESTLSVTFNKYDATPLSGLKSIHLEYRRTGTTNEWTKLSEIPKSALVSSYYLFDFDVKDLPDGNYEIRAVATCNGANINYSPIYSGKIEQNPSTNYRKPTPTNGILTKNDEIGVTLLTPIDGTKLNNKTKITLTNKATGAAISAEGTLDPLTNTIIVSTSPAKELISKYENIEIEAKISELVTAAGSDIPGEITWSFVVNHSDVKWSPASLTLNATEGKEESFTAKLINISALSKNFKIKPNESGHIISALNSGTIPPLGEQNISFVLNKNLNSGNYTEQVVVECDGKEQILYLSISVLKEAPNWAVNSSNYKFNANLTLQFSTHEVENITSEDTRDKIALFVGEECRGVANIQKDETTGNYVAYVSAFSNTTSGEKMKVRLWDANPGLEYQSLEDINFIANGVIGNTSTPYIVHPEGVFQTIPLAKGWNFVSFNVKAADMTVANVLKNLKPTEGDVIKTLDPVKGYSQYNSTIGWNGPLDDISIYRSYMISTTKADTIRLLGQLPTERVDIQLENGWNWVGYPMAINTELDTYLKNYNLPDSSTIDNQTGEFSLFNGASRSGTLKYLRPGKGYKIYVKGDNYKLPVSVYDPTVDAKLQAGLAPIPAQSTNTISNVSVLSQVNAITGAVSTISAASFEKSSTITAELNFNGLVTTDASRFQVYVYIENELVNILQPTILPNGKVVAFIPVNSKQGDDNKNIFIKIYDTQTERLYNANDGNGSTAKNEMANDGISTMGNQAKMMTMAAEPLPRPFATQQPDRVLGTINTPTPIKIFGDADVKVSNSVTKGLVNTDDHFTYTIAFQNFGSDPAVESELTHILSNKLVYVSSTGGIVYNPDTHTLRAEVASLARNEKATYTVVLKAKEVGTFSIGEGEVTLLNDANLFDNTFNTITISAVNKKANVFVTNNVNKSTLIKGQTLEYNVKIKNNGPDVANNILFEDIIPSDFEVVSTTQNATFNTDTRLLEATFETLAVNAENNIKVVLKALTAGNKTLGNGGIDADNDNTLDYTNNDLPNIAITVQDNNPDLAVSTTLAKDALRPNEEFKNLYNIGDAIKYTIEVKNNKTEADNFAMNYSLVDNLSTAFEFVSATNGLVYDAQNRTLSAAKTKVNPGEKITYTVNLKAAAVGNATLGEGNIVADNDENNANNAIAPKNISIVDNRANVWVSNVLSKNNILKSQEFTYSISATNNGPEIARDFTLTDVIPNGFELISANNGATYNSITNTVSATKQQIRVGEEIVFELKLKPTVAGNFTFGNGTINAANDNYVAFDNNTIAVLPITVVENDSDIALTQTIVRKTYNTSGNAAFNIGDQITYNVNVVNNGPNQAVGYKFTETLANAFEFVSASGGVAFDPVTRLLSTVEKTLAVNATQNYQITLKAINTGNFSLANGAITALNDANQTNNTALSIPIDIIDRRANVWVSNALERSQVNKGEEFSYTIVATNNGPDIAQNFSLTENLPDGLTFLSGTNGISYNANTKTLQANAVQLKSGEVLTYTIKLKAAQYGTFNLGTGVIDADNDNNIDFNNNKLLAKSISVINNNVNFNVANTSSRQRINIGDQITYTIKVKNNGPDFGMQYKLTDPLSFAFDVVSLSSGLTFDINTRTFNASKDIVNNNEAFTYNVVLKANTVGQQTLGGGTVTVLNDTDLEDNNIAPIAIDVVDRRANVWVSNNVNKNELTKSQELTYNITVSNSGPDVANNFTISDVIPANFKFISATEGMSFNANNNTLNASRLHLKSGEEITFAVKLKAIAHGQINLGNGTIAADNDNDVYYDNNTIKPIAVNIVDNNVDFMLTTNVDRNRVNIGDILNYNIQAKNNSNDFGMNYKLVDQLSDAFEFVSASNGLVFDPVSRTLTVTASTVQANANLYYNVVLKAAKVGSQNLGNGIITVDNEINAVNNTANPLAIQVVDRRANVTVANKVSRNELSKNEELTYTLTVINNGPDAARNVTLNDIVPVGFKVTNTPNTVSYSSNNRTLKVTIPTLAANQQLSYNISLLADKVGLTPLGNGNVNADNDNDVDFDNNAIPAIAVNVLDNSVDLVVTNSASKNVLNYNETFDYTIKIKNNGPNDAINTKITDKIPFGFELVEANEMSFNEQTKTLTATKDIILSGGQIAYTVKLKTKSYGELNLGNGSAVTINESNEANNQVPNLAIEVTDPRAGKAKIVIPSLFTPNGDGVNDTFEILGLNEHYVSNNLTVYNKNYNVVYKKQNYQNDWNGGMLPMGSYGYVLKVVDKNGVETVFKGAVTIVYQ